MSEPRSLEVVRVLGPATVQDGGRPGHHHEGVPAGGALVPELLARANRAAGNAWDAAAIEFMGPIAVRALAPRLEPAEGEAPPRRRLPERLQAGVEISVNGACVRLAPGEVLEVPAPAARAGYLAVRGGLDVPLVLGGRGTLLVAGLGGHEGRLLRAGDLLPVGGAVTGRARLPDLAPRPALRVIPGPDLDRAGPGALPALLAGTFRVSPHSDRVGMRLEGPALPRDGGDEGLSIPMVRGAIQLPASGVPVILGPDHPTTGGYPVIAVVIRADHGRLGSLRPGDAVRFEATLVEEARAAWREHAATWRTR